MLEHLASSTRAIRVDSIELVVSIVSLQLLIAFLHSFIDLSCIFDRVQTHVGLLDGTDLSKCLVEELVHLRNHF